MRRNVLTAVVAVLASGVSAVAASFALFATSERFLVSSFNLIVLDYLPGWMVARVIRQFGDNALWYSMVFSGGFLAVFLGVLALVGFRAAAAVAPQRAPVAGFTAATVLVFVCTFAVVREPLAVVVPALIGGGLVTLVETSPTEGIGLDTDRRGAVLAIAGLVGFNVVAHVIGLIRRRSTQRTEQRLADRAARLEAENMVSQARSLGLDAENTQPLVSEIGDFYVVDINPEPPAVDAGSWSLSVTGRVPESVELDYDDVRGYETVNRYKAIRCLSDDLGDNKLDNAVWTGVRMSDVLADVDPQGSHAMLYGADDYYYSMPLDHLEECLLAYGMNGFELPQQHGYPVRLLVPDRWGKLHVKWLTEIEIINSESGGFWEAQGWHGMGPVNAVTKLDRISRPEDGSIRIVGHAYAGGRGVEAVEVTLDGGDTWEEAQLSEALPDDDTLRQWLYEIDADSQPEGDAYEMAARVVDGEGNVQPSERTGPFPNGATGWIRRSISP
jgi:DMSO/TMAO reductase YedYZ molybdopterin-dependent catalytic subunit